MPRHNSSHRTRSTELPREQPQEQAALPERAPLELDLPGWVVGGMVLVGLGLLAWSYLGPDLKRYLKIRNM